MPIVSFEELKELAPDEQAIAVTEQTGLTTAYVETDIDLERERHALSFAAELRARGYRMFLDGKRPADIAKKLNIKPEVALIWARDGQWGDRLRKINNDHEALVREGVRRVRLEHAEADARESLELGERIREVVKEKLAKPGELRSQDIKNYADAAKATGDLADHGSGATSGAGVDAGPDGSGGGRKPLVVIFNGGTPPIVRNAN